MSVPGELPGASAPLTTVDGTMPVPLSIAPAATRRPLELVRLPLATSWRASTGAAGVDRRAADRKRTAADLLERARRMVAVGQERSRRRRIVVGRPKRSTVADGK